VKQWIILLEYPFSVTSLSPKTNQWTARIYVYPFVKKRLVHWRTGFFIGEVKKDDLKIWAPAKGGQAKLDLYSGKYDGIG
jgi:hypothetical protein